MRRAATDYICSYLGHLPLVCLLGARDETPQAMAVVEEKGVQRPRFDLSHTLPRAAQFVCHFVEGVFVSVIIEPEPLA